MIDLEDFPDNGDKLTLDQWEEKIKKWKVLHGGNAILEMDAGHNNISAEITPIPKLYKYVQLDVELCNCIEDADLLVAEMRQWLYGKYHRNGESDIQVKVEKKSD